MNNDTDNDGREIGWRPGCTRSVHVDEAHGYLAVDSVRLGRVDQEGILLSHSLRDRPRIARRKRARRGTDGALLVRWHSDSPVQLAAGEDLGQAERAWMFGESRIRRGMPRNTAARAAIINAIASRLSGEVSDMHVSNQPDGYSLEVKDVSDASLGAYALQG
jgi:hypothetical protein